MGDEIARGRCNKYLIQCYEEVCKSIEERVQKTLLWKNAKPSLPGSPCHCRYHGVAPHGGAARSNFNTLCYIDDAIVFSNSWAQHVDHIRRFLTAIQASGLQLSATKCKIVYPDVTMLDMQISRYGLATTGHKVAAVTDVLAPTTMAALHRVVGMFGYYRNFIENFLRIARPLNDLKKASGKYAPGARIIWTDECEAAFKELKSRLSSTPILAHPKYDRPFILHTDASKDGFGAVLSQIWMADDYRAAETPDVAFDRMPDASFTISNRTPDVDLDRTRTPNAGLTGSDRTPDIAFDRMPDAGFAGFTGLDRMTDVDFDRTQDAGFNSWDRTPDVAFDRTVTPDAGLTGLNRAQDIDLDRTRMLNAGFIGFSTMTLDAGQNVSQDMTSFTTVVENSDWMHAYQRHPTFSSIYRSLQTGAGTSEDIGFSLNPDGLLLFRTTQGDRICLPANKLRQTFHTAHDVLGHFGRANTHARVMDTFYRPGLATAVAEYVRHCPECSVNKLHNIRMVQELGRIDAKRIPDAYEAVNIDFIVNLPKSGQYDAIMVIVDRFTKAGTFIPCTSNFTAENAASMFFDRIVSMGFLPTKFITDRDPRLVRTF